MELDFSGLYILAGIAAGTLFAIGVAVGKFVL